jgi:SAM-dependent methyltransferase
MPMAHTDYSNYVAWKGWSDRTFGSYDKASSAYFRKELSDCGIGDISDIRVLELGFGNGSFAGWIKHGGGKYVGVEAIEELADRGRACGFETHAGKSSLGEMIQTDSCDLVVAFDVFEHISVDELRTLLHEVRACLRSRGRLLARVPSGDSPFSRAIQYGDLSHRAVLGSSAIVQLAGDAGFEVQAIREPAFPLRGMGIVPFFRRMFILLARKIAFPVIATAMMGGGRPVLTPNMVFVLVKP